MRNFFQKLLSSTPQREATRVPDGQRVYAVGDIHGYAKLFWDPISADCDAILRYLVKGHIILAYIPEVLVKVRVGGREYLFARSHYP